MKRGDIILLAALLLLAGALSLLRLLPGGAAVWVNGKAAEASLAVNGVVIEIDGSRARVVSSPCADKRCVQTGWLELPGDIAVCLPQQVILEIRGTNSGVDGIAY